MRKLTRFIITIVIILAAYVGVVYMFADEDGNNVGKMYAEQKAWIEENIIGTSKGQEVKDAANEAVANAADAVKDTAGKVVDSAADAAKQGAKDTAGKVVDAAVETAKDVAKDAVNK